MAPILSQASAPFLGQNRNKINATHARTHTHTN